MLWCVASWVLSAESDPERYVGVRLHLPDKLEHAIEYLVGGVLAAGTAWPGRRLPAWAAAILFCSVWGAIDEVHQSFVPERDSSVYDVAADVAGAAAGAALLTGMRRRRQRIGRTVDEGDGTTKERTRT